MEAARLRAQVRASATQQKKKEENKTKGVGHPCQLQKPSGRAHKRKFNGKDDCPPKKPSIIVGDKSLKQSTPLKTGHGVGKGLMTSSSPVAQGSDRRLLTHKDYAIEMVGSIIRDKDVDPSAK